MKKILVTGAQGQLGKCVQLAAKKYTNFEFIFASKTQLDITKKESITAFFNENAIDYCINTAAYTQVDQAEKEKEKAFLINGESVKNLAVLCKQYNVTLLQVSTDYVFDGTAIAPYTENAPTNPIGIYGASKLQGEQYIETYCSAYYIIRTSWLYSQFGHNFFKTITKYASEGKNLTITTEQKGCPTNANDLAHFLLNIIISETKQYGIYHYNNTGVATWYDFAAEILKNIPHLKDAKLAKTDHYPTFAKRPAYSVMDTEKAVKTFKIKIENWKDSLKKLIENDIVV